MFRLPTDEDLRSPRDLALWLQAGGFRVEVPDAGVPVEVQAPGLGSFWVVSAGSDLPGMARLAAHRSGGSIVVALPDAVGGSCGIAAQRPGSSEVMSWSGSARQMPRGTRAAFEQLAGAADVDQAIFGVYRALGRRDVGRRFFADLRGALKQVDAGWSSVMEISDAERRQLSLSLFTRLLFLYFVQTKGWLPSGGFLAEWLLAPGIADLYAARAEPLFFEALNRPVEARSSGSVFGGVPFLNGGLFARSPLERRLGPDLLGATLRALIAGVFERYRFVDDECGDHDNAVDPEMLGRVFEELMGEEQRAKSGAFYTPPDLVARCAYAALLELDPLFASQSSAMSRSEAERVIRVVDALRVLDPAAGSGAFLLGCARILSAHRARAMVVLGSDEHTARAESRKAVVANCLYAVDVSATAVQLCTLRLWMFLASAISGADVVEPLPNLEHKVRHGNALIDGFGNAPLPVSEVRAFRRALADFTHANGPSKAKTERALRGCERRLALVQLEQRRDLCACAVAQFAALRKQPTLFGEARGLTLGELKREATAQVALEDAERELRAAGSDEWRPDFAMRLQFADVFSDGGFDLVIGNPPWIRMSELPKADRLRLRSRYRWVANAGRGRAFGAQPDVAVAFVERATQLVRDGGIVSQIVPSKLFRAGYGGALRAGLRRYRLLQVRDLSGSAAQYFEAEVYPAWLMLRVEPAGGFVEVGTDRRLQPELLSATTDPGGPWPLWSEDRMLVLRDLLAHCPPLSRRFRPRMGVKTGCNAVFVDPPRLLPSQVALLRGGDVGAMTQVPSGRMLFVHDRESGAVLPMAPGAVVDYVAQHESRLRSRSDAQPGDPSWQVYRCSAEAVGHRVAWRDIATRLEAVYLPPVRDGGPLALNSVYTVSVADEAQGLRLAAWLNGVVARFCAEGLADDALSGYRRYQASTVGSLPCPEFVVGCGDDRSARFTRAARRWHERPLDALAMADVERLCLEFLGDSQLVSRARGAFYGGADSRVESAVNLARA